MKSATIDSVHRQARQQGGKGFCQFAMPDFVRFHQSQAGNKPLVRGFAPIIEITRDDQCRFSRNVIFQAIQQLVDLRAALSLEQSKMHT